MRGPFIRLAGGIACLPILFRFFCSTILRSCLTAVIPRGYSLLIIPLLAFLFLFGLIQSGVVLR